MASVDEVLAGNLGDNLYNKLKKSKVLVVGAGGIGCELLKTLVLSGFNDIEVIDLDTIDVSNLNRQFLFQKQHVGKSKAEVARQSAIEFNPEANIKAYHDSITSPDYDVNFFRQFSVVLNALDNKAARNHVNRMCLAADVPLVESGTAGYLGQVTVIKKNETECYECQPKPHQKSYPGCTIRNTPSEPIHCIVWAKHLFNQLFGEADVDEEVSPDTEDPEAAGRVENNTSNDKLQRVSTQEWAKSIRYDPEKLVKKLFVDDIKYLLLMDKLWKERVPPVPLDVENLSEISTVPDDEHGLPDQKVWQIKECVDKFCGCALQLKADLENKADYLVWDKDHNASLDFVVSASNIRAHIFNIQKKSRFDVKSMAGNIIPAIATTNAVISGLIVLEAMKAISGHLNKCRTLYLNKQPSSRKKLLQPSPLVSPNLKCYVCSSKPEVTVTMDCSKVTVKSLEEKLLKQMFGVLAPDVEIDDGKGAILVSSEEGETEQNNSKFLSDFGLCNGSRLKVDDFHQNFELVVNIVHSQNMPDDEEFIINQDFEKNVEKNHSSVEKMDLSKPLSPKNVTRKRKASDSIHEISSLNPKCARYNKVNNDTAKLERNSHTNDGFSATESNKDIGSKPTIMIIDDDDDDNNDVIDIDGHESEASFPGKRKEGSNSNSNLHVLVIVDDEEDNDNVAVAAQKSSTCDVQVVVDDDDDDEEEIIIL